MKLAVNKLPEFWRDITRDRDIAYKDRIWIEGYDAALAYCAQQLEAALAQQAGADYRHVATISQTQFGFYWIDWHENVAYRKGLKLFASSAPGCGGEVCTWTCTDHPYEGVTWDSACGVKYCFTEEGPEENGHKFCHCCGKPLSVLRLDSGHDDDEPSDESLSPKEQV